MKPAAFLLLILFCAFTASATSHEVRDSVLYIAPDATEIDEYEFAERTDFHTVKFPSSCRVAKIGRGAFSWCENLREVALPRSVTDIAAHAFAYCFNLRRIDLPGRLTHIGSNAFCFCTSLEEVEMPASITEVESYAFAECYALRRAVLPANPNMLGELIFCGCRDLREIVEMSATPPTFDCNSTLFDPEEAHMYTRCKLIVPQKSINLYRKAPGFSLFYDNTGNRSDQQPSSCAD